MDSLSKHAQDDKAKSDPESNSRTLGSGVAHDVLEALDLDPALNRKMHLVNDALDQIGWTPYHWKLFFLCGMGYGVDALQVSLQGIIAIQAAREFQPSYPKGLTIALYVGMLVGALFWGLSADIVGRRLAFNISLFICSAFTIVAGASPSWVSLGFFIAFSAFGAGGNLILDTTVLLEYLPSNKQWLVTGLASWWGVGCTIAGLVAWGFMPNYSCSDPSEAPFIPCNKANNSGWRYLMYTMGAMIFAMSIARVAVVKFKETPKFLLGQRKDSEVVERFHQLAEKYHRPCSITLQQLEDCGPITTAHAQSSQFSLGEFSIHMRSLLSTKKLAFLMALLWLSWLMLGLAYPLFNVFLPSYLASRGVKFGVMSTYETWRNYALAQVCSIFGPIVSAYLANQRFLGRRYTMTIGGLLTMSFLFAYSQVTSQQQNVAYTCLISFTLHIYAACLYGYTVEVLPSAHRATGNGVSVALHRFMGIIAAIIATTANTETAAPVFICAALYGGLALCAVFLPFEPYAKRAS